MIDFKLNGNKIVAGVFIAFISAFMVGTIANEVISHTNRSLALQDNAPTLTKQGTDNLNATTNPIASTANIVKNTINKVEISFNIHIFLRSLLIDYHGLVQRIVGKRVIEDVDPNNVVIKDASGQLLFVCPKGDITEYVRQMVQLKTYLDQSGIKLLFVQAPYKVLKGYTALPPTVKDFSNENADNFLSGLAQNNIDYIDLREELVKDNLNNTDTLFFKTDHHWQIQTAFWGFAKVVNRLNSDYKFNIDKFYTDIGNYNQTTYKNIFLGTQGKRVGKYYDGVDDFTLITPKFDTAYKVTIKQSIDNIAEYTGSFNQAIIRNDLMDLSRPVSTNRYAVYLANPGCPEITIKNNTYVNGKILIIKDSFGMPFSSFLSVAIHEIRMLDLRYYQGGNLFDYLKNYSPDVVLFIYNPGAYFGNPEMFKFQ